MSLRINQFSPMPTWKNALTRFLFDEIPKENRENK